MYLSFPKVIISRFKSWWDPPIKYSLSLSVSVVAAGIQEGISRLCKPGTAGILQWAYPTTHDLPMESTQLTWRTSLGQPEIIHFKY